MAENTEKPENSNGDKPLGGFKMTPLDEITPEKPWRRKTTLLGLSFAVVSGVATVVGFFGKNLSNREMPEPDHNPVPISAGDDGVFLSGKQFEKLPANAALVHSSKENGRPYSLYVSYAEKPLDKGDPPLRILTFHLRTSEGKLFSNSEYLGVSNDLPALFLQTAKDVSVRLDETETTVAGDISILAKQNFKVNLNRVGNSIVEAEIPSGTFLSALVLPGHIKGDEIPKYFAHRIEPFIKEFGLNNIESTARLSAAAGLNPEWKSEKESTNLTYNLTLAKSSIGDLEEQGRISLTEMKQRLASVGIKDMNDADKVLAVINALSPTAIPGKSQNSIRQVLDDIRLFEKMLADNDLPSVKLEEALIEIRKAQSKSLGNDRNKDFLAAAAKIKSAQENLKVIRGMTKRQEAAFKDNADLFVPVMGEKEYKNTLDGYKRLAGIGDNKLKKLADLRETAIDQAKPPLKINPNRGQGMGER